jgi:SpoVK/Ycf46/Vps4 family AAA+-type ATPase
MGWNEEVPSFTQLLEDCRDLYRRCAREYAELHQELIQDSAEDFVARMVELQRGLVLKVFMEMAQSDHRVGAAERKLARELFEHAWGRTLNEQQLKEAFIHYAENTQLRWDSLLRPFERFSSFIPHAAQLQTLVLQLAWRVAQTKPANDARVRQQFLWIRSQLQRSLERVPLAGAIPVAKPLSLNVGSIRTVNAQVQPVSAPSLRQASASPVGQNLPRESLDDVLHSLDELIGLDSIKQEVRELVNFLNIQSERRKLDLPLTPICLHAVYAGNPGTGKTTVARLVGRILGSMGILARGHLVETDRSGLVAEYAGQTAPKANKRIDEALDGVLFIDEAYSLVAEKGDDPYGAEAVQTLLKRMEDDRDRLVVILAGYPGPMRQLIRSNPGLSSRFNRSFSFPDYTAREMGLIFHRMCERDRYLLPSATRVRLLTGFAYLLAHRNKHFGNGRLVRNIFERSIRRLANRLAMVTPLTRELLTTLQPGDLVFEDVPLDVWRELDLKPPVFDLPCPLCRQAIRLPGSKLGQAVACHVCRNNVSADWGDPIFENGS